jgi:aminodeoxyfutalosine synthase
MTLPRDPNLHGVAAKVRAGERLRFDDGVLLYRSRDLLGVGHLADIVRRRHNGNRTHYVVNRHINPTNICQNRCRFCAFSRDAGDPDAYALTVEQALAKAREACPDHVIPLGASAPRGIPSSTTGRGGGVSEFHIVGGLHPDLPFEYYLELLSALRAEFPSVHLQAFTAVEIDHLARLAGLSVRDCLLALRDAGLGSLPGGGAEVFSPRVRRALCPEKLRAEGWLEIMRTAHELGLRSNATMLYGHMETAEEVIDHLLRLRELQDDTGGFLAFIPLAFHPQHTQLEGEVPPSTTAFQDLRAIAIARLMLDNFPHVKVFWIMVGLKLAQVALGFGADDIDGTVTEERITHAAGAETPEALSEEELVRVIEEAGFEPFRRDTLYNPVPAHRFAPARQA